MNIVVNQKEKKCAVLAVLSVFVLIVYAVSFVSAFSIHNPAHSGILFFESKDNSSLDENTVLANLSVNTINVTTTFQSINSSENISSTSTTLPTPSAIVYQDVFSLPVLSPEELRVVQEEADENAVSIAESEFRLKELKGLNGKPALPAIFPTAPKIEASIIKRLRENAKERSDSVKAGLSAKPLESFDVLLKTDGRSDLRSLEQRIRENGGTVIGKLPLAESIHASIPEDKVTSLAKYAGITENHKFASSGNFETQLVNATQVWAMGYNGSGVKIAVLDTGIDASHPEFTGRIIAQQDFTGSASGFMDVLGHGTHVAGIAAGNMLNGGQFNGVAPGALLMNAKVLDDSGSGTTSSVISGLQWALSPSGNASSHDGANVIIMSFGSPYQTPDDPLIAAIQNVVAQGVTVVVASGNCGSGCTASYCNGFVGVTTPGNSPDVITVGAVDDNFQWACFSGGGNVSGETKPDLVAPGISVYSSIPGNSYRNSTGTSMSTPFVGGAAALLLQQNPGLPPSVVKAVLESSATDLGDPGKDVKYGSGFLNAYAAVLLNITNNFANLTVSVPKVVLRGDVITIRVNSTVPLSGVTGSVTTPNTIIDGLSFTNDSLYTWEASFSDTSIKGVYVVSVFSGQANATTFFQADNLSVSLPSLININATAIILARFKNFNALPSSYGAWLTISDGVGNVVEQTTPQFTGVDSGGEVDLQWPWQANYTGQFLAAVNYVVDSNLPQSQSVPIYATMPIAALIQNFSGTLNVSKGDNATYSIIAEDTAAFPINASIQVFYVLEDKLLKLFSSPYQIISPGSSVNLSAAGPINLQGGTYAIRVFLVYGDQRQPVDTSLLVQAPQAIQILSVSLPPNLQFGNSYNASVLLSNSLNNTLDVKVFGQLLKNGEVAELEYGSGTVMQPLSNSTLILPVIISQRSGFLQLEVIASYENNSVNSTALNITALENQPPLLQSITSSSSVYQNGSVALSAVLSESSLVANATVTIRGSGSSYSLTPTITQVGNTSLLQTVSYSTQALGNYSVSLNACDELGNCNAFPGQAFQVIPCSLNYSVLVVEHGNSVSSSFSNTCVSKWDSTIQGEPLPAYYPKFKAVYWNQDDPTLSSISPVSMQSIYNYVQGGGAVFFAGPDIAGSIYHAATGNDSTPGQQLSLLQFQNLTGAFFNGGFAAADITSPTVQFTSVHKLDFNLPLNLPVFNETSHDLIRNKTALSIASFNDSNSPAILVNKLGKGKIVYADFSLSDLSQGLLPVFLSNSIQWLKGASTARISINSLTPGRYLVADGTPNNVSIKLSTNVLANLSVYWDNVLNQTIQTALQQVTVSVPQVAGAYNLNVIAVGSKGEVEDNYADNNASTIIRVAPYAPDARILSLAQANTNSTKLSLAVKVSNVGGMIVNGSIQLFLDNNLASTKAILIKPGITSLYSLGFKASVGKHSVTVNVLDNGDYNLSDNTANLTAYSCNNSNLLILEDDNLSQDSASVNQSAQAFYDALGTAGYCASVWSEALNGEPTAANLSKFPLVIYASGNGWSTALSSTDQALLLNYPGRILFEGSNLGADHSLDNSSANVSLLLNAIENYQAIPGANNSMSLAFSQQNISQQFSLGLNSSELTSLSINGSLASFFDDVSPLSSQAVTVLALPSGDAGIIAANSSMLSSYYSFAVTSLQPSSARPKIILNTVSWLLNGSFVNSQPGYWGHFRNYQQLQVSSTLNSSLSSYPLFFNTSFTNCNASAFSTSFQAQQLPSEFNSGCGSVGGWWIPIPALSNLNTSVYYYNNSDLQLLGNSVNATSVWDPNYLAVWHFENESTSLGYDSTAFGNNLFSNSALVRVAPGGVFGNSVSVNQQAFTVPAAVFNTMQNASTIEAWVWDNNTSGASTFIDDRVNGGANPGGFNVFAGVGSDQGRCYFSTTIGEAYVLFPSITPFQWHYVVCTYNGTTAQAYVDGELASSSTTTSPGVLTPGVTLYVGQEIGATPGRGWNGLIDEVRISNVSRSPEYILANWNATRIYYGPVR